MSVFLLILAIQCLAQAATLTAPNFSQLPSTAAGPPIPTHPAYRLQALGEGAYMVTDGNYQSLFFVACESAIAVDAPPTIGENILRAIRSVTTKPISHVIYSHHHGDHISGAYLFGSPLNITYIAHQLTADELALTQDYNRRPAPTITFEDSYTLNVCNQTLQLDYRGPNRDPGNIFIFTPKQKILMVVDVVYPGWIPFDKLAESQNIPGWIRAHDQILTYDFDYYVGGHLDRTGTRGDVLVQREYVRDLFETSKRVIEMSGEANNSVSVQSVIAPYAEKRFPNNSWALFDIHTETLADYIAKGLEGRWSKRLYAYDVYGRSHAAVMLESVRIDFGFLGPFGVINA